MQIRRTKKEDLERLLEIYASARKWMAENGNPNQWKDYWPYEDIVIDDIETKKSYVLLDGDKIVGVSALITGEDPCYSSLRGGSWLNDEPYVTIHRIAGDPEYHGIFEEFLKFALTMEDNVRVDTHEDNKKMQHCLIKNGFKKCGIIRLDIDEDRIAYHCTHYAYQISRQN